MSEETWLGATLHPQPRLRPECGAPLPGLLHMPQAPWFRELDQRIHNTFVAGLCQKRHRDDDAVGRTPSERFVANSGGMPRQRAMIFANGVIVKAPQLHEPLDAGPFRKSISSAKNKRSKSKTSHVATLRRAVVTMDMSLFKLQRSPWAEFQGRFDKYCHNSPSGSSLLKRVPARDKRSHHRRRELLEHWASGHGLHLRLR